MQLSLAADRLVGPNFRREVARMLSSTGSAPAGRSRSSPPHYKGERPEEPEWNPDDKEGKKSEKKEDMKREEDP